MEEPGGVPEILCGEPGLPRDGVGQVIAPRTGEREGVHDHGADFLDVVAQHGTDAMQPILVGLSEARSMLQSP